MSQNEVIFNTESYKPFRFVNGSYHNEECAGGCGAPQGCYHQWTPEEVARMKQPDAAPASDPKHARKMDAGKIPLYQGCLAYFARALLGVALVSEYGKRKYDPENPVFNTGWAEVPNGELRYRDAEVRHLLKADVGSTGLYDDESEIAHALHKAWNALADAERLLREGKIELRCGVVIVNGKPQPGTSKKVEL